MPPVTIDTKELKEKCLAEAARIADIPEAKELHDALLAAEKMLREACTDTDPPNEGIRRTFKKP